MWDPSRQNLPRQKFQVVCVCVRVFVFVRVYVCVHACTCGVAFLFSLPLAWGLPGESLEL